MEQCFQPYCKLKLRAHPETKIFEAKTLWLARVPKIKIQEKSQISSCKIMTEMVSCKSPVEEVSFEWSHPRISSTDSKVRTTLHVSIIVSGSERVDNNYTDPLFLPYRAEARLKPRLKLEQLNLRTPSVFHVSRLFHLKPQNSTYHVYFLFRRYYF